MTPTNEAGHGLPELPEPLISGGNDKSRPDLGRGCTGYTAAQVQQYAIDYAAALALSRGVPGVEIVAYLIDGRVEQGLAFDKQAAEDMAFANAGTVVPLARADAISLPAGLPKGWYVERVSGDADLYVLRTPKGLEWIVEPHERLHVLLTAMLAAAPAAAGAQGEDAIDRAARRMGDSARSLLEDIAQQAAPQPAAADGGVREQHTAAAEHWHDLYQKECRLRQDDAARYGQQIVDLEAAISSHRQAGDAVGEVGIEGNFIQYAIDDATGRPQEFVPGTKLYTAPPLSKFRELAEMWLAEDARRHSAPTELSGCADDLLELVEKGAGS